MSINRCNAACESTEFIEFMLDTIKNVALDAINTTCFSGISKEQDVAKDRLLVFCKIPRTRSEMQEFCCIPGRKKFNENFLKPLLDSGKLIMTIPDKPNSRNQKYVALKGKLSDN